MALASQADVEARLGRLLTATEATRLPSLLSDASATVEGYCNAVFTDPYPEAVVGVVAKMVARSLSRAGQEFTTQQAAGPFSSSYSPDTATGDMWLTKTDKLALRLHRAGGGLTSVQLVGDRYDITDES